MDVVFEDLVITSVNTRPASPNSSTSSTTMGSEMGNPQATTNRRRSVSVLVAYGGALGRHRRGEDRDRRPGRIDQPRRVAVPTVERVARPGGALASTAK